VPRRPARLGHRVLSVTDRAGSVELVETVMARSLAKLIESSLERGGQRFEVVDRA
jgi:hypothetical protein